MPLPGNPIAIPAGQTKTVAGKSYGFVCLQCGPAATWSESGGPPVLLAPTQYPAASKRPGDLYGDLTFVADPNVATILTVIMAQDHADRMQPPASGNPLGGTQTVQFTAPDAQMYDQTAGVGLGLGAVIPTTNLREILIRISLIATGSTRSLSINGQRLDATQVPILIVPAFGGVITDVLVALGLGAAIPAAPLGAGSLGSNFAGPLPTLLNVNLAAGGADQPRMTIWGRGQS